MSETGKFLNPYNFIPFPEKKCESYGDKDTHTGVIEYSITTRSPLFIPNTSSGHALNDRAEEHKSYDFYSYTELEENRTYQNEFHTPVIPGSELRGMIRSIYETLTDSCMGVLEAEILPVKRSGQVFWPALLHRSDGGKLELVGAEDCVYKKSNDPRRKLYVEEKREEGEKVYFEKINRKGGLKPLITDCAPEKDERHPAAGYLLKGMPDGSIGKKHNCHVFIPSRKRLKVLEEEEIARLFAVLRSYQSQPGKKNAYESYEKRLRLFLSGKEGAEEYFPVYFSRAADEEGELWYLSPACMTKEVSHHSIGELAGAFRPCEKKGALCPACDLFGMMGKTNEDSVASRIRFADAYPAEKADNKEYFDADVTLESLAEPKIANTEFYLKKPKPDADYWTYDYYTAGGSVYLYRASLRGRKFYWHQNEKKLPAGVEKTKLNQTVRPVKSGVTFTGKLYFDRISNRQLKQLLWILNGGNENEQPKSGVIAYKLGSGKPLGLGSVELNVEKLIERKIEAVDGTLRYHVSEAEIEIPYYEAAGFSQTVKEDFMTISSLDAAKGVKVSYPIVEGQRGNIMQEGYQWFVKNHLGYDYRKGKNVAMPKKRTQMKQHQSLPEIKGVGLLPESPCKQGRESRPAARQQNGIPRGSASEK